MNLKLNPLNSKNSEEKTIVNEVTFWEYYFQFLNLKKRFLTPSEITFLSYYLVNPDFSFLADILGMQRSNYYGMLKKLAEKKILHKTEDGYRLHFNIQKLKDYLTANKPSITFTFPLEIEYA